MVRYGSIDIRTHGERLHVRGVGKVGVGAGAEGPYGPTALLEMWGGGAQGPCTC